MKNNTLSISLSVNETVLGGIWFAFQFLMLPSLLSRANTLLSRPLSGAGVNFCYYVLSYLMILCIFRSYLGRSLAQVRSHPAYFIQAVVLGLAAYMACSQLLQLVFEPLWPEFSNLNDAAIARLSGSNYIVMAIGTVLLVPPVEECLFRGLIFRNLYTKSHKMAYLVSMIAFSAIHVVNYLGSYSPLGLLLAFLQYLPAGLCLAWSYTKADTIFAPILIHGVINATAIYALR